MDSTSAQDTQRGAILAWHFQRNQYPPIPLAFIPAAERALELAEAGDLEQVIDLPNGLQRTAGQVIEDLRLWDMLEGEEEPDGGADDND